MAGEDDTRATSTGLGAEDGAAGGVDHTGTAAPADAEVHVPPGGISESSVTDLAALQEASVILHGEINQQKALTQQWKDTKDGEIEEVKRLGQRLNKKQTEVNERLDEWEHTVTKVETKLKEADEKASDLERTLAEIQSSLDPTQSLVEERIKAIEEKLDKNHQKVNEMPTTMA